jgi:hypothetical protein
VEDVLMESDYYRGSSHSVITTKPDGSKVTESVTVTYGVDGNMSDTIRSIEQSTSFTCEDGTKVTRATKTFENMQGDRGTIDSVRIDYTNGSGVTCSSSLAKNGDGSIVKQIDIIFTNADGTASGQGFVVRTLQDGTTEHYRTTTTIGSDGGIRKELTSVSSDEIYKMFSGSVVLKDGTAVVLNFETGKWEIKNLSLENAGRIKDMIQNNATLYPELARYVNTVSGEWAAIVRDVFGGNGQIVISRDHENRFILESAAPIFSLLQREADSLSELEAMAGEFNQKVNQIKTEFGLRINTQTGKWEARSLNRHTVNGFNRRILSVTERIDYMLHRMVDRVLNQHAHEHF